MIRFNTGGFASGSQASNSGDDEPFTGVTGVRIVVDDGGGVDLIVVRGGGCRLGMIDDDGDLCEGVDLAIDRWGSPSGGKMMPSDVRAVSNTLEAQGRVKYGDEKVLETDLVFFVEDNQGRLTLAKWADIRPALQTAGKRG